MPTLSAQQGDVQVLTVDGYFAGAQAGEFRLIAQQCLERDARDFVVDVANLTGVDSAGLEALTWLQRTCLERLGMVTLAGIPPVLEQILHLTRLDNQLEGKWNVNEAVESLR